MFTASISSARTSVARTSRARVLSVVSVLAMSVLLTGCPDPVPLGGGGVATIAQTYGNCSGPSAGDVIYRFNPEERLDVFPHIAGTSRGTILFVHGGAFKEGDKRGNAETCGTPGLASLNMGLLMKQRERGWDIVSVNYRLVTSDPGTLFPGALIDVVEAVKWAQGLGGQLTGINGSRIVVAGHSAGGTIAALMGAYSGTTVLGNQFPGIAGWISVSGILEYGPTYGTDSLINSWVIGNVFGFPTSLAVPASNLGAGDPPGYLIQGSADPIVPALGAEALANFPPNGASISLDEVRTAPDSSNHWAIGGADYYKFIGWLDAR